MKAADARMTQHHHGAVVLKLLIQFRQPCFRATERQMHDGNGKGGDLQFTVFPHIHQLQHVSISTVQPVIDALKTEASSIVAYEPTNTMIITETGLNLRRILGIVEMLDVPGGQEQIFMYQAQYASADDLKSLIEDEFGRVWVVGEISNLRLARSGHSYFTLKDDEAQIRAALRKDRRAARKAKLDAEI